MDEKKLIASWRKIFALCDELSKDNRREISPDGHLVGGIGEAFAISRLRLKPEPASNKGFDAKRGSRKVEIKTTTVNAVALSGNPPIADDLVVVKILRERPWISIVYDGPYRPVWEAAGKIQKNNQRRISLSTIEAIASAKKPKKKTSTTKARPRKK